LQTKNDRTLNKHKELRLFLKGDGKTLKGEITEYAGVTIEWIRGKRAIMTIFENGQQKEDVQLYELQTREQMHNLMKEKGFHRKTSQDKIKEIRAERTEKQLQQVGEGASFYGQMVGIYFLVILVVFGKYY
jgi:hypothetical protein